MRKPRKRKMPAKRARGGGLGIGWHATKAAVKAAEEAERRARRNARDRRRRAKAREIREAKASAVALEKARIAAIESGKAAYQRHYAEWSPPAAPKGRVYEWKAVEVQGKPVPIDRMDEYAAAGWKPVPKRRHPGFVLLHHGHRLMERSKKRHEQSALVNANKSNDRVLLEMQKSSDFQKKQDKANRYILTNAGWVPESLYRMLENYIDGCLVTLEELKSYLIKIMGINCYGE